MDYLSTICTGFMHLNFKASAKYMQGYRENKPSGKEEKSLGDRQEAPVRREESKYFSTRRACLGG